jgi:hypothetical protein
VPTVTGGVSRITGGTNSQTVRTCLQEAVGNGDCLVYLDWGGRKRYAPAADTTAHEILTTADLELRGADADTLRGVVGIENRAADTDRELIEYVVTLIGEVED